MKKITNYFGQFHKMVWVLLIGTVLARGSSFMTLPFLSIYLSRNMDLPPIIIGLTVGMSPLMGTVGGFIGGNLSDRFGRKRIMLISVLSIAIVFYCFTIAKSQVMFILLNALNGLCNSCFEPISQALMADLTDKKKRMKVYSLRYTAINIGASVGPLIGAYFANHSAKLSFFITGSTYFLYAIALFYFMNKISITTGENKKESVTFRDAFSIVKKDMALRYLILGIILVNIGYVQIDSNLPQHLDHVLKNGVTMFSFLISINAIMVVLLQLPVSHFAEKFKPMQMMVVGAIFISGGLVGFSFVNGWAIAIISIFLITLGEILIFPANSILIDRLAPDHLRGTYFGAGQFRKIGSFAGPIIGGYFLSNVNGQIMFWVISIITLCSIFFFQIGNRSYMKRQELHKETSI
ncbi:MAG: MFS transporter [Bacillota bacterium]|nr:MFS transporter [Bacillota bacterium]